MASKPPKLTAKQERFVAEYLIDLNATQAAIRAGYSKNRADAMGHENLRKPEISASIGAAVKARSERTQVDSDWLLRRLADEAEADIADLYDSESGALLPVKDWPKVWRQGLVSGIDTNQLGADGAVIGQVVKVKLADRTRIKELIGKHVDVGAFRDHVEHSGPNGGPIAIASIDTSKLSNGTIAELLRARRAETDPG